MNAPDPKTEYWGSLKNRIFVRDMSISVNQRQNFAGEYWVYFPEVDLIEVMHLGKSGSKCINRTFNRGDGQSERLICLRENYLAKKDDVEQRIASELNKADLKNSSNFILGLTAHGRRNYSRCAHDARERVSRLIDSFPRRKNYSRTLRAQSYHRFSRCWNCKTPVDNAIHDECGACHWIVCSSCAACGCGFHGRQ